VSHPNVCRVHDYAEHDGQPFLSMEYIDGEDLASLLKRIRRLPRNTRWNWPGSCAWGWPQRTSKTAAPRSEAENVMIDGRGQCGSTDFGLAGRIGSFTEAAVRAGTPLYQAPEQLGGTKYRQSDIYALGLVLYEMVTGKRAFQAPRSE